MGPSDRGGRIGYCIHVPTTPLPSGSLPCSARERGDGAPAPVPGCNRGRVRAPQAGSGRRASGAACPRRTVGTSGGRASPRLKSKNARRLAQAFRKWPPGGPHSRSDQNLSCLSPTKSGEFDKFKWSEHRTQAIFCQPSLFCPFWGYQNGHRSRCETRAVGRMASSGRRAEAACRQAGNSPRQERPGPRAHGDRGHERRKRVASGEVAPVPRVRPIHRGGAVPERHGWDQYT